MSGALQGIVVLLLTTFAMASCSRGTSILTPTESSSPQASPRLRAAIKRAAEASGQGDPLLPLLRGPKTIVLKAPNLVDIGRLAVLEAGRIAVLDPYSRTIDLFSESGDHLTLVGGRGQNPGQYITPSDVVAVPGGFAVDDFTVHRVTTFSPDGKYVRSFVYTNQAFSSVRCSFYVEDKVWALFGNKWKPSINSTQKAADLASFYDENGHYMTSALSVPVRFDNLNVFSDDAPEMSFDRAQGTLLLAMPFEYKVYELTSKGKESVRFDFAPPAFHEPTKPLVPGSGVDGLSAFQDWTMTWTPIVALWRSGDSTMVEYQTFAPLRYTVDVWSSSDGKLIRSLQTNYRHLAQSADGRDWFAYGAAPVSGSKTLVAGRWNEAE